MSVGKFTHFLFLLKKPDFMCTFDIMAALLAVPPCYYAHLAAARARVWLTAEGSDSGGSLRGSVAGGSASSRGTYSRIAGASQRQLPPLHERIRSTMFYI